MNNSKILTGQSYSTLFSTLIHVRPNMRHKIQTEIVASHTSKSTESPLQPKNIFQITTFLWERSLMQLSSVKPTVLCRLTIETCYRINAFLSLNIIWQSNDLIFSFSFTSILNKDQQNKIQHHAKKFLPSDHVLRLQQMFWRWKKSKKFNKRIDLILCWQFSVKFPHSPILDCAFSS